jgi:hypothetical protein
MFSNDQVIQLVNAIKIIDYISGDNPINVDFSQFSLAELNHFADVLEDQQLDQTNEYFEILQAIDALQNSLSDDLSSDDLPSDNLPSQIDAQTRLSGLFSLSHTVSLTLPSTVEIDKAASDSLLTEVYNYAVESMSNIFGGCTVTSGQGAWYSDSLGRLVLEQVNILTSFAAELSDSEVTKIIDLAEYVKAALSQESVLITLDGKAYFV